MGTFDADTYVTGTNLNTSDLSSVLEDKLAATSIASVSGSDLTISSATYANLVSTALTVADDEVIRVEGQVMFSGGTVSDRASFRTHVNGVSSSNVWSRDILSSSTSGNSYFIHFVDYWYDVTSGSVSIGIEWARSVGSGTLYTEQESIHAMAFKRR